MDIVVSKKGRIINFQQTIFIDIDDVFLNTSETIIQILKDRFPEDTELQEMGLKDLKQWNYDNFIKGRLYYTEVLEIFESDEFWDNVEIDQEMWELVKKWRNDYNFVFVSKGTEKNLFRKKKMLSDAFNWIGYDEYGFYGVKNGCSKNVVNMSNGIQIDDNYKVLEDTNASIKILFRNPETRAESEYNGVQAIDGNLDNLYVTEFVDEIDAILDFNYNMQSLKFDNEELLD